MSSPPELVGRRDMCRRSGTPSGDVHAHQVPDHAPLRTTRSGRPVDSGADADGSDAPETATSVVELLGPRLCRRHGAGTESDPRGCRRPVNDSTHMLARSWPGKCLSETPGGRPGDRRAVEDTQV